MLTIPPTSVVYPRLDALASLGLLDAVAQGERPLTDARVAQLYAEASRNLSRLSPARRAYAERLLADVRSAAHLRADGTPPTVQPLASLRLDALYLDSPARRVPGDSIGRIDATINPLVADDNGRSWRDGSNLALETLHQAALFDHIGVAIRPRFTFVRDTAGRQTVAGRLEAAYATLSAANVVLEVGRDYVGFEQGVTGGLLVSDDAPALDMVRVGSESPFRLPWILRAVGPMSGELFVADLGPHQNYPHAKLIGYALSFMPSKYVELGAEALDQTGGNGAPGASFFGRVEDAMVLPIPVLRKPDLTFSNKLAGLNVKVRSPNDCLSVYVDGDLDDSDYRRLKSTFLQDGGYVLGASAACLDVRHGIGATAEFHSTGIRYYTHNQFSSGVTYDGDILGDQLGPRGYGGLIRLDAIAPRGGDLSVELAAEIRSGNEFAYRYSNADFANFRFKLIGSRPPEQRQRVTFKWTSAPLDDVRITARGGIERVRNFEFTPGRRFDGLAGVGVEYPIH